MGSGAPTLAIHSPNTLWSFAIDKSRAETRKPDSRPDSYVYFLGARSSGKSTLVNKFLYPDEEVTPNPTEGLEYTFARTKEASQLAHIWELSGGEDLTNALILADNIFLGPKQVTTAVVVIVVDLSDPGTALESMLFWLDLVQQRLKATFEQLQKRGSKLPEQLCLRSKKYFGSAHEDSASIQHSGVALIVAATKYDAFRDQDAEVCKVMARTLRYVAHCHGASLAYVGGLQGRARKAGDGAGGLSDGGRAAAAAAADRAALFGFRSLLSHLAFTGWDRRISLKTEHQTDHLKPLLIPMGVDRLRDIGRPRGGAGGNLGPATLHEWRAVFEGLFPPKPKPAPSKTAEVAFESYPEPDVDVAREAKDAELAAQRKQKQAALQAQLEARKKALIARQLSAQRQRSSMRISGDIGAE